MAGEEISAPPQDSSSAPCIRLFGTRISAAPAGEPEPPPAEKAAGLPCPRCRSRETKFCYFNNYNVNQPRHYCRGCQRYWTAGGALRNVPVGAGRRKSRSPPRSPAAAISLEGSVARRLLLPSKRPNNGVH